MYRKSRLTLFQPIDMALSSNFEARELRDRDVFEARSPEPEAEPDFHTSMSSNFNSRSAEPEPDFHAGLASNFDARELTDRSPEPEPLLGFGGKDPNLQGSCRVGGQCKKNNKEGELKYCGQCSLPNQPCECRWEIV